jgi:hypothetical protein
MYGPGTRDQRLESFAQGRWGDRAAVGAGGRAAGWLALQAGDVSQPGILAEATSDEVLGVGRAWKSLETWCFTGKLAVVRELIRRYPLNEDDEPGAGGAGGTAAGGLPDEWDPRLHHEVAAALGISVAAAAKLVSLAWTLDGRLRGIGTALDELRLDPPRVKMIVDETSVLDREDLFARTEAIILAGLSKCKTWADLARLVQRAVITVDPDGARKRREQAEREHARIRFWREAAGTCALRGTGLPTDEALAATGNIEARALEYKAALVRRPMDILRVMAYLDLINGVTVAQRAAWAQAEDADDEARQANDEQAARDAALREATRKARQKARERSSYRNANPGPDGNPKGDGPDSDGPDNAAPGDGPDGPAGGGAGGGGNGGPSCGGAGAPDSAGQDDADPGGATPGDPSGDWPCDGGGLEDEPDDGPPPADPCADCEPGTCPCQDWVPAEPPPCDECGSDCRCGVRPGRGQRSPDSSGTTAAERSAGSVPCPECGNMGGIRLPVKANLAIPAGVLEWLAGRSRPSTRGPGGAGFGGGGSGGGGPGASGGPDPCPECMGQGSANMPAQRDLVLPLLTLLGLADRSGEAHGLGALDPALARDLAAAGARHWASEFCVTIIDDQGFAIGHGCGRPWRGKAGKAIPVDPDRATFTPSGRAGPDGGFGSWILTLPGALVPFLVDIDVVPTYECDHRHASAGYQPSGRLRHLVQVRDGTCSFPACSRHARESDWEHAQPFDKGGATCACNAHACSRSCHRVKQSPSWQVTKPRPGWTQWTTMTGRIYTQGPWRYPA